MGIVNMTNEEAKRLKKGDLVKHKDGMVAFFDSVYGGCDIIVSVNCDKFMAVKVFWKPENCTKEAENADD